MSTYQTSNSASRISTRGDHNLARQRMRRAIAGPVFSELTTRGMSFWPDHYVRELTGNRYVQNVNMHRRIDIPDIEL